MVNQHLGVWKNLGNLCHHRFCSKVDSLRPAIRPGVQNSGSNGHWRTSEICRRVPRNQWRLGTPKSPMLIVFFQYQPSIFGVSIVMGVCPKWLDVVTNIKNQRTTCLYPVLSIGQMGFVGSTYFALPAQDPLWQIGWTAKIRNPDDCAIPKTNFSGSSWAPWFWCIKIYGWLYPTYIPMISILVDFEHLSPLYPITSHYIYIYPHIYNYIFIFKHTHTYIYIWYLHIIFIN
jgi:hypothetical protein